MIPELANWHFGGVAAILFAYGLPLATAGRSSVRRVFRAITARRNALAARRAADDETATLDVGDTILHGRVEYAQGQDLAVRVCVEQLGSESESSGSWTVTWSEHRRIVEVAPFYVVHASGDRVRVEPNDRTQLAGMVLGGVASRADATHRTRVTTLAPDQSVWITGMLDKDTDPERAGGYRGSRGWVMRPKRGEPMVVSTVPPEDRLRLNARRATRWAIVFGVVLVGMLLVHTPYHALVLSGHSTSAHVTGKRVETSSDSDDTYVLDMRVDGPRPFDDTWNVTSASFEAVAKDETLPAYASFGLVSTSLPGHEPRLMFVPGLVTTIAWLVLAIIAAIGDRAKLWYEGAPVNDTQSGRLVE